MNAVYPKELYRNNHYRVVFGVEEDAQFQAQGWKEEKTPGQEYVVYHSGIPESTGQEPEAETEEAPAKRGRPKKAE